MTDVLPLPILPAKHATSPLVTRRLSAILELPIDFDALREASNEWESQVSQEVEKNEELADTIRKLEEEYDNELIRAEAEPQGQ